MCRGRNSADEAQYCLPSVDGCVVQCLTGVLHKDGSARCLLDGGVGGKGRISSLLKTESSAKLNSDF